MSFYDYFPAEGLGYFTLTFCAGTAFQIRNGLEGLTLVAIIIIFLLVGFALAAEIERRLSPSTGNTDRKAQRNGFIAMSILAVVSVIISLVYLKDLAG